MSVLAVVDTPIRPQFTPLVLRTSGVVGVVGTPFNFSGTIHFSANSILATSSVPGNFALNPWTNFFGTGSGSTLIEPAQWAACYRKGLDTQDFFRKKCWIGVDLAEVLDMCAIGLIFEMPNDVLAVFSYFFLPEDSPTATNPDMFDQFQAWHESGHLTLTKGALADHDVVREMVEMFCDQFDVQVIGCDPKQAHNTVKHLWDGSKPVLVYPNNSNTMTAPTDDLLGRIVAQTLVHDNNPVLGWNVQNVYGERKGNGTILPRKETPNSKRKIDGWVAITMANGIRILPGEAKDPEMGPQATDPYVNRGIIGFEEMTNGR